MINPNHSKKLIAQTLSVIALALTLAQATLVIGSNSGASNSQIERVKDSQHDRPTTLPQGGPPYH